MTVVTSTRTYDVGMDRLDENETAVWRAWKRATDAVRARVVEEITAETGLSDPDFGVLTRVVEDGEGRMRQNQLAESMGFHRSRLSHHLSRMEQRGLVTRRQAGNGVEVLVTETGRAAVAKARPVHAAAVRRHLLGPFSPAERETFLSFLERLASP
jgi:DNA-binding MarR family transcriptional regulator